MKFIRVAINDLRDRHLWPVAAGLLVAIVAIPLLLMSHGGGGDSGTSAAVVAGKPHTATGGATVVAVADSRQSLAQRLQSFNDKDPFRPQGQHKGSSVGSDAQNGAAGAGSTSNFGGSTIGSDTQPGGTTSNGQGNTIGSDTQPGGTGAIQLYVVDVKIGSKTYKDVKPGKSLPSSSDPLVIYAGTETGSPKRADFFLANGLSVQYGKGASYVAETDMLRLEQDATVYISEPDGTEHTLTLKGFGTKTVSGGG